MNARNCFNQNGTFDFGLLYVELFNKVPSQFTYSFPDEMELDGAEITFDKIQSLYPNIGIYRSNYDYQIESPSEVEKSGPIVEFDFSFNTSRDAGLTFVLDDKVVFVNSGKIVILYDGCDVDDMKQLAEQVYNCFPKKPDEDKTAKVSIVKCYQGDYYTSEKEIRRVEVDINENYNDDFKKVYDDTVKFLEDRSSGLILFYGPAGTGKTHLIRHLVSAVPREYIIVPNSIASRLGDPDMITFVTDHTDSVFILEDCEQLLEDRGENPFNNAISTILNMADGLLSDICNIKFICTFNAPVSKIDPALLRKGRCVAKYDFGPLCKEKVAILNEKYNLGHTEIKDMTLAEVYNADKTDYTENDNNLKIGF